MLASEGARAHGGKLVLAAAAAALAAPSLGHAADLTALSAWAQAYAHPGGQIVAGATVRATGSVRAASQLRFYLSANRTRDKQDVLLSGGKKVPGGKAGRRFKAY